MMCAICSKRSPRHEPWPAVVSSAIFVFVLRQTGMHGVDRADDFVEARFDPGAQMRARMQDQKRQLQLIRADQFLRQRAQRVGVKLRIGRGEIDQVVRVREDGVELGALA